MRRPVGIIQNNTHYIIAICDDGTMWLRVDGDDVSDTEWIELDPPIPGTPAAEGQVSN